MPKFFDPSNYPKQSVAAVTIYGSVITLSGAGGTCAITINGIENTVIATYAVGFTETAAAWVLANAAFYKTKGFVVTSAANVITVTPLYGWDTVNRIHVTVVNNTLTGALTGKFEPDLAKAKTWHVTFGQHISILRPKNMVNGDKIRLLLNATGNFTTT